MIVRRAPFVMDARFAHVVAHVLHHLEIGDRDVDGPFVRRFEIVIQRLDGDDHPLGIGPILIVAQIDLIGGVEEIDPCS